MSPWQLESVLYIPRSLPLKFYQNRVRDSWDINAIESVWWWGGWVCKVIFTSNPTKVMLGLGWVVVGVLTIEICQILCISIFFRNYNDCSLERTSASACFQNVKITGAFCFMSYHHHVNNSISEKKVKKETLSAQIDIVTVRFILCNVWLDKTSALSIWWPGPDQLFL